MENYHVHVYRVRGMLEMTIEAQNAAEARKKALEKVRGSHLHMGPADCEYLPISFNYYREDGDNGHEKKEQQN